MTDDNHSTLKTEGLRAAWTRLTQLIPGPALANGKPRFVEVVVRFESGPGTGEWSLARVRADGRRPASASAYRYGSSAFR